MFLNGLCKRRGVGTIIAGAFLVMIIIAGFEFFLMNNKNQNDYQKVLSDMRSYDIERAQEILKIIDVKDIIYQENPETDPDYELNFNITIRNDSPFLVKLNHIGIFWNDGTGYKPIDSYPDCAFTEDPYLELTDKYLETSEIDEIGVPIQAILPNENSIKFLLQVVTSKGNIFSFEYPTDESDYGWEDQLIDTVSKYLGKIVPLHDSFFWGKRELSETQIDVWHSSLLLSGLQSDEVYAFKIQISYFDMDHDMKIKSGTRLQFTYGSHIYNYFIVGYDGTTLSQYDDNDPIILEPIEDIENIQNYSLCFATNKPEGRITSNSDNNEQIKFSGLYEVRIVFDGLYMIPGGREYKQTYPVLSVEVP
jgi:hypothetical protein